MGWTQIESKWVYVSPSMSISAAGVLAEPHEVELESRLPDYRLIESAWTDSVSAFSAAISALVKRRWKAKPLGYLPIFQPPGQTCHQ
jgi:hypothetical protein